jgi:hypothetical protein
MLNSKHSIKYQNMGNCVDLFGQKSVYGIKIAF